MQAGAMRGSGLPWAVLLFEAAPVAPLWTGLGVTVAFLAVFAVFAAVVGAPFWDRLVEYELLYGALLAYAPMTAAYALRGSQRDLRDLGPVLTESGARASREIDAVFEFHRGPLLVAGLVGLAVAVAVIVDPTSWPEGGPFDAPTPILVWALAKVVVFFWLIARSVYIEIAVARRLSRIGERWIRVDLLDLRPLAPFARHGLRSVLIWMGFALLVSLLFLQPWGRGIAAENMIAVLAIAVAALLLPVLGLHRRLVREKEEEQGRVREAIAREREGLFSGAGAARAEAGSLADLAAYGRLVDEAPTWPFDLSTLVRFGLYLLLGLASWIGAAAVERLLDVAWR